MSVANGAVCIPSMGLSSIWLTKIQGLLTALNSFMVQKEYRAQALTLLCEFVQSEPPHLHVVLETPLFDNILKSLQSDTSTTVVTLAVTALTMLLPNVPSSLVPYLPKLFNIYARLLFWDRERSLAADYTELDGDDEKNQATDWEVCVFAPDADNMSIPNLLSYFTILYGLYPLNFVDYIRKPQRYLRHANMPNADDIEVQPSEIRQKSERFRQYHILHPNFYNLTLESEKTDFSRWIKSESSEVVTECTALCLATELGVGPEMGPAQELGLSEMEEHTRSGTDQPFLTGQVILTRTSSRDLASAWRNSGAGSVSEDPRTVAGVLRRASQSSHAPSLREAFQTRARDGPGDSPTLPPSLALSASHTNLQDMITSNKAIKTGLHQSLANDSVPSLALSHQESMPDKTSSKISAPAAPLAAPPSTDSESEIQRLYKQILLLSNDLSFERYMKQQHMIHIGELKRRQLKEAATEAETQNLIMINRNLRNRIEEAKRSELRAKKESENRRNIAKKWETDLSAKLKLLREEQKKWSSEGAGLKRELEAKTEECEKLTRMVCEYETTELNSKQNLQAINDHVEEIARLKAEVSRLIEVEQTYQAKEKEAAERLNEAANSIGQAQVLHMKLEARDAEVVEVRKLYESQISDLNTKLQDALEHGGRPPRREEDPDKAIESALAASRAKMADLQRRHEILVNKCTVLQASLLEKQTSSSRSPAFSTTPKMGVLSDSSDAELSAIVQSGDPPSPVRRKSRRGRTISDPELFVEGAKYNVTPPLDTITPSSFGTALQRPSTRSGSADTLQGSDRSPTDRFHGRGKLLFSRRYNR
jgi:hypothetical protein